MFQRPDESFLGLKNNVAGLAGIFLTYKTTDLGFKLSIFSFSSENLEKCGQGENSGDQGLVGPRRLPIKNEPGSHREPNGHKCRFPIASRRWWSASGSRKDSAHQ